MLAPTYQWSLWMLQELGYVYCLPQHWSRKQIMQPTLMKIIRDEWRGIKLKFCCWYAFGKFWKRDTNVLQNVQTITCHSQIEGSETLQNKLESLGKGITVTNISAFSVNDAVAQAASFLIWKQGSEYDVNYITKEKGRERSRVNKWTNQRMEWEPPNRVWRTLRRATLIRESSAFVNNLFIFKWSWTLDKLQSSKWFK